jgi:demethoxyubiquinone hydroxylase (CLK1/Coq7/Cat5 family)
MDTLKTCAQGALGAMTFGAYHMYVTTEMMKQNNKYFEQQIHEMKEENKELKQKINNRWFF